MTENNAQKDIDNAQNNEHNDEEDVIVDAIDEDGSPQDPLRKLRDRLKKCEEDKKEFLDGWQRAKADSINQRKRDEESRIRSVKAATDQTILSFLPVLDSFEMALAHTSDSDETWVSGIKNIHAQFLQVLKEYGITQVDPQGEKFDPAHHDSIESRPVANKKEDGMVIEVVQKGYMSDTGVLRAARVVVGDATNE